MSLPAAVLFDTHLHIQPEDDGPAILQAAREKGVAYFVIAAAAPQDTVDALALTDREPGVLTTAGLHPHEASAFVDMQIYRDFLCHPKVVAVGEVGLDYHYDFSPRDTQRRVFEQFLDLAAELNRPVVVHCREAYDDCLALLRGTLRAGQKFLIHSYTGTPQWAETVLELGGFFSFNGIVTFNKAENVRQSLRVVPLSRLLLETDSPYLAPVPYRGRRNTPAYLPEVAACVAAEKGVSPEELAALTTRNGLCFYEINGNDCPKYSASSFANSAVSSWRDEMR